MHVVFLSIISAFVLSLNPPEDDRINSENKAQSVRPPASDFFTSLPIKKKSEDDDKHVLAAEELKKIEGKKDQEIKVKGTVNEVFLPKSGSIAILNFGKDNKKCFKVVVYKSDFEKFDGGAEGIKKKYTGKSVTVEGKVSMYQGLPQIAVKTPSQIRSN